MNHDASFNIIHPLSLSTSISDNETYNLRQAMNQDDREIFILAMAKEMHNHEESKYYNEFWHQKWTLEVHQYE